MKRVLVCDDDITISEIVALVLTDADWEVYTLPDCVDIVEKVETINPSVIFMDNNIPDEGGIVATRAIKSHPDYQEIPVVYFTANSDIDELAKQAGADFILQKPFNITDLEDTVSRAFKAYSSKQSDTQNI